MSKKILFLTNNDVSQSLIQWLEKRVDLSVCEEKINAEYIQRFDPDLVISYSYRHIIKSDVLDLKPGKFINLHISYLPYNRGADPNIWSFLENTLKGVTIHLIDEGLDTGLVLVQKQIEFDEKNNTLNSSYRTLQKAIQDLFIENWEGLRDGTIEAKPQKGVGSYHHSREFAAVKQELLGDEGWDVTIEMLRYRYNARSSNS